MPKFNRIQVSERAVRLPRIRLWLLMLLVALSAVSARIWIWSTRANGYRAQARIHARFEETSSRAAGWMATRDTLCRERIRARIREYGALQSKLNSLNERQMTESSHGLVDLELQKAINRARSEFDAEGVAIVAWIASENEWLRSLNEQRQLAIRTSEYHSGQRQAFVRAAEYPWFFPPRP
jgi:hypothetical protein